MPMYESFPLKLAVQTLCGLAHAIPVSGPDGEIIDLLTQSDVNKFIYENGVRSFLNEKAGYDISRLGLVQGNANQS